jgi:hypothetical protein
MSERLQVASTERRNHLLTAPLRRLAMRLRGVCVGRHGNLLMRAALLVVFVASAAAAVLVRLAGWLP